MKQIIINLMLFTIFSSIILISIVIFTEFICFVPFKETPKTYIDMEKSFTFPVIKCEPRQLFWMGKCINVTLLNITITT